MTPELMAKLLEETHRFRYANYDPTKVRPGLPALGFTYNRMQCASAACYKYDVSEEWVLIVYSLYQYAWGEMLVWIKEIEDGEQTSDQHTPTKG